MQEAVINAPCESCDKDEIPWDGVSFRDRKNQDAENFSNWKF